MTANSWHPEFSLTAIPQPEPLVNSADRTFFTSGCIPDVSAELMGVTKTELRKVITKLDDVKMELLRLRAALLPKEPATARERKLIDQGQLEIEKGRYVTLAQLRKELNEP